MGKSSLSVTVSMASCKVYKNGRNVRSDSITRRRVFAAIPDEKSRLQPGYARIPVIEMSRGGMADDI